MRDGGAPDPVRATLVAILQQLNRAESLHEGRVREQVLALADLERMLANFWAIDQGHVKVSLALGLLVLNGMVEVEAGEDRRASKTAPRGLARAHYRITTIGKLFLIDSVQKSDRIA